MVADRVFHGSFLFMGIYSQFFSREPVTSCYLKTRIFVVVLFCFFSTFDVTSEAAVDDCRVFVEESTVLT